MILYLRFSYHCHI